MTVQEPFLARGWSGLRWLNPPAEWHEDASGALLVTTAGRTDFWRETHYGFIHDSGHFLFAEVPGDFEASVRFRGGWRSRFDHAGLMLRLDGSRWLKTGVEFVDGAAQLSVVVTDGRSDWSVAPGPPADAEVGLRVARVGGAVLVQHVAGDGRVELLRLAPFPVSDVTRVGVMACSPEEGGTVVSFRDFQVRRASGLHPHD